MDDAPGWVAFLAGVGVSYLGSILALILWMWISTEFKEPE